MAGPVLPHRADAIARHLAGLAGLGGLVAAAPVLVVLARGDRDPMVSAAQPAALVPDPRVLPCLGHNAHVEDPAALLPLIDRA